LSRTIWATTGATPPIADDDDAIVVAIHAFAHSLQECTLVEGHLGEQDDVWRIPGIAAREAACCRDPARMPTHDLENEHLGRGLCHRQHVERRFLRRYGHVLGDRSESRAVVGHRQIVVDGLGDAQALHREAHLPGDLGYLVGGIHRVIAAVVKEVAYVVRPKHIDQAFVFRAVLLAGIDHVLGERPDDAVAAGIDVGDLRAMFPGCLDDPTGRCVDHGGDAAGLGIKRVFSGHSSGTSGWWSAGASA
jgi:hypothetical protein